MLLRAAGTEIRQIVRGGSRTHRDLRDRLVVLIAATVVIDLVCAVLAWLAERHAQGTQLGDLGTALFWTTTQLLSVSSSIVDPLTTGGRVLDVGMEIYAITVVAYLAASIGTFFHRRSHERETAEAKAAAG
jgi:hypothetical protein